jgi:hypothetical protein
MRLMMPFLRIVLISVVAFTFGAPSAHAFFDPPWITPMAPIAGEDVSVNIRMGICDAVVFRPDYPQITRQGNAIRIVEYGDRVPSEDFCIYPILTTAESLGSFAPGEYVLTVDFVYENYPLGYATDTLGIVPFTVAGTSPATPVSTFSRSGKFSFLILVAGTALWALRRRRRSGC